MTLLDAALLLDTDQQPSNKSRHFRYRSIINQPSRSMSQPDSASVIVAYQDVTAESGTIIAEDDLAIRPEMEESFCKDFVCCGQFLPDLHALLHHYEDCHVRFESGDSSGGYNNMSGGQFSAMMSNDHHHQTGLMEQAAGVRNSPRGGKRRRMLAVELEQCDFLTDDTNVVSAFDNTVLRTISHTEGHNIRRPHSVPASINYSKIPILSGNPSDSPIDQYRFIHSILSATIDNPDTINDATSLLSTSKLPSTAHQYTAGAIYRQSDELNAHFQFEKSDRPYICPIAGCGKAYKNPNGLKYHEKHGHDSTTENVERPHKCAVAGCGKRYKNPNGLKYHMAHAHPNFVRHLSGNSVSQAARYPSTPHDFVRKQ